MKRLVPATIAAVLTVGTFLGVVYAAGSFNQKLSPNQQIIHALNRLTYGPHPGDVEEVRRIGLAKWIELQLHPDQIPENPVLEAKLKPLATLNMSMADVVREYTPRPEEAIAMMTPFGPLSLNSILSLDQVRKVMNGTAEERTEVLKSLPPDKRKEVLAGLPPNVLAYTPEFKDEAPNCKRCGDRTPVAGAQCFSANHGIDRSGYSEQECQRSFHRIARTGLTGLPKEVARLC